LSQSEAAAVSEMITPRLDTSLQTPLSAVGAVLRCANEHFHEVVVQGIVELALETPFELRIVEVARVEIEIVGVHGDGFVFEFDDDLNALAFGASGKVQKRMLVEVELGLDAVEARVGGIGHVVIVEQA